MVTVPGSGSCLSFLCGLEAKKMVASGVAVTCRPLLAAF